MLMAGGLALSLLGTGCVATHKYVARSIAPVEQRVSTTESKNVDQDKQIATQATQIEGVDRDLSRTKERVNDVDSKATAAGDAAKQADAHAAGAQTAAEGARTLAQQGVDSSNQVSHNLNDLRENLDKYKMVKSETVLFGLNKRTLNDDAKAKLDDLAKSLSGMDRYVIEVQGFTDKTGPATYNDTLSQERAAAVARHLANQYKVPLHSINMLGTGVAEGDQKTRAERAQGRKVDVRIYVPNYVSGTNTASN